MPPPTNTPFPAAVRFVRNGDPVAADNTNAPTQDVAQRTQNLRERMDSLEAGSLLRLDGIPLTETLLPGAAVYLGTDGALHGAVTSVTGDVVGGTASLSSYPAGILLNQTDPAVRSIGLQGIISGISLTQWSQVIVGGVAAAGHYYLSDQLPGMLTRTPGALSVYMGQLLSNGEFLLRPEAPRRGEHVHYEFELSAAPAGTTTDPATGQPHVISAPNPALRGWLPAVAPYFDPAVIPADAKFGYNLQHPDEASLAAVFPPAPLDGSVFVQEGQVIGNGFIKVTQHGIWWLQDSYGMAPWPVDFVATSSVDNITMWFSHLMFTTSGGVVASLANHPQTLLPMEFLDRAGQPATDGPLLVRISTILVAAAGTVSNGQAVKQITGNQMSVGPVVDALVAGPGVQLSGSAGDANGWSGKVVLSVINSDALQGDASVVNLHNATEDTVRDTQVVMLRAGRVSQPVYSIEVSRRAPATNKMRIATWLFSSQAGAVPAASLTLEYRVIPPPGASSVPLPTGWTALQNLAGINVTANGYVETSSPVIEGVPAGAVVLVRATRQGVTDGFTGNLGFVRVGFTLE